jgi:hypothetical protein
MPNAVGTRHTGAASKRGSTNDGTPRPAGQPSARSTAAGNAGHEEKWGDRMAGVIVAVAGLLALLGIMVIAILELPNSTEKGSNIVALASAGFGVIGAVVGAFFGVRAANRAVNRMSRTSGGDR